MKFVLFGSVFINLTLSTTIYSKLTLYSFQIKHPSNCKSNFVVTVAASKKVHVTALVFQTCILTALYNIMCNNLDDDFPTILSLQDILSQ